MIVILNDNEMSISPNVGALSAFLSRAMTSDLFRKAKRETEHFLGHLPRFGKELLDLVHRAEHSLKGFLTPGMLFEASGFDYVGPIDGHKLDDLLETLRNVAQMDGPVLVHVLTKKGKGYPPAEQEAARFHGVGPFDLATGASRESKGGPASYTGVFGKTLCELAEKDPRIVAITAAMPEGTGLHSFAERFPQRFFDVGIIPLSQTRIPRHTHPPHCIASVIVGSCRQSEKTMMCDPMADNRCKLPSHKEHQLRNYR